MHKLNLYQSILFQVGGVLMVLGAVMPLFLPKYYAICFTVGAVLFSSMQMLQRYEGKNIVIRRLRRQQLLGALLILLTAIAMWVKELHLYAIGDAWKLLFAIAAVLEIYSVFRIDSELKKAGEL